MTRHYDDVLDDIILRAKQAQDYFLLVGPPGTGKTSRALKFMVEEALNDGTGMPTAESIASGGKTAQQPASSILLMSYTNRAVDEICEMLVDSGIPFLRLGSEYSCDERFRPYLIEKAISDCPKLEAIKQYIIGTRVIVGTTSMMTSKPFIFSLKHFIITDNYTGDPATTKWEDITGTMKEGVDWTTWETYKHDLSDFKGKKNVVIALHYACAASSGTWEVKNLSVKEATGGTPDTPSKPDTPATKDGITINGLTVTLANSGVTAGESLKIDDVSALKPDATPTEIKLSDGTVIAFDKNSGTNAPAYNSKFNELRIYANNKMTFTASKPIAKIIFTCTYDTNKNWNAVGNETATVVFSGNTATYTNTFSGTGGGVQLRIAKMEIVYAK